MAIKEGHKKFKSTKIPLFKTVDIFSDLLGHKIYLKNGPDACTNGTYIFCPLEAENAYLLVEHELAHIVFKSDPKAKALFIKKYTQRIAKTAKKYNAVISLEKLSKTLGNIIGILEDHRVDGLWAKIYPGSARLMQADNKSDLMKRGLKPDDSIINLMCWLSIDPASPAGQYKRCKPHIIDALKKVEGKGFLATLVTAKWLVMALVDEVIKLSIEADSNEQGSTERANQDAPENRLSALDDLLDDMGDLPSDLDKRLNDIKDPEFQNMDDREASEAMAQEALKTARKDLEDKLVDTASDMQQIVASVQSGVQKALNPDERLRKGAMTRVIFHDVGSRDIGKDVPTRASVGAMRHKLLDDLNNPGVDPKATKMALSAVNGFLEKEDKADHAIARLRASFYRVSGRRKLALMDSGDELDLDAWIERKITRLPIPVFRDFETGRGFSCLILLDRSISMAGAKAEQTERAARIIARSMDFPFVSLGIWGFKSEQDGQVDIVRYNKNMERFSTGASDAIGATPLHTAIRIGSKWLGTGSEVRHLFVITDGVPCYFKRDGSAIQTNTLLHWSRNEILQARSKGITVTGVQIGKQVGTKVQYDLDEKMMSYLFGASSHWKRMPPQRLETDLTSLVSRRFVQYLRTS